jgi:DNA-binding IclR family transcriptional regulator
LAVVFNLTPSALQLFQYFITALKFNDERVIFDAKEAAKVTGYSSKQTIVRALAELINAEIIARSPASNIYFINPKAFVKGNRLDMIRT